MKLYRNASALFFAIFVFIAGCGGSGTSGTTGTTNTSQQFAQGVALGDNVTGNLSVTLNGTTATGTLTSSGSISRLSYVIPAGDHALSGTNSSTGFSLSGPLPGGKTVTVTGKPPSGDQSGEYTIQVDDEKLEGGFLPVGAAKPSIGVDPNDVGPILPGAQVSLTATNFNLPTGTVEYQWSIVSPGAYFESAGSDKASGQAIKTPSNRVTLYTSAQDRGKIKAVVRSFLTPTNGKKVFVGEATATIGFEEIEILTPSFVTEVGVNPNGNTEYTSYLWEFPTVASANRYVVTFIQPGTQFTKAQLQILTSDINNTEVSGVPIYFGALPHSFPPKVPFTYIKGSMPGLNVFRRGAGIRLLLAVGDPGQGGQIQTANPCTVTVFK